MKNIKIALIVILLLCLVDMPYGYYALVRFLSMIGCAILAYDYYSRDKEKLAITFGVLSLLFQPFIKIALGRELWSVVDVAVAVLLAILLFKHEH